MCTRLCFSTKKASVVQCEIQTHGIYFHFHCFCVMFTLLVLVGPDICGYSTKKVHVIFNYKGQNHLIKKDIKCKVCFVNVFEISWDLIAAVAIQFFRLGLTGRRTHAPVHADPAARPDVRSQNRQRESGVGFFGGRLGFPSSKKDQGSRGQEARGLGRPCENRRSWRHKTWGMISVCRNLTNKLFLDMNLMVLYV